MKTLVTASLLLFLTTSLFSQLSREVGFWKQSYYEKGNEISKQEVGEILKEVDLSNDLWQAGKKNDKISVISSVIGLGGILYTTFNDETINDDGIALASLGATIVGIVTSLNANKKYNLAIRTYNKAVGKGEVGFMPKLILSPSKVGLLANF